MPGLLTTAEPEDIKTQEERLVSQLRQRAKAQISGVNTDSDVHIRDVLPDVDLDQNDVNNDNTADADFREWLQSGLTADQLNQVYEIDSSERMEKKIIGIFALSFVSADPITTEIVFEDGTGSKFERLMVQEVETFSEGAMALLRNPIIFNEGKDGIIHQWANDDGMDRVVYHGAIAEKAGTTLGTRSQGEQAATGTSRRPQRA